MFHMNLSISLYAHSICAYFVFATHLTFSVDKIQNVKLHGITFLLFGSIYASTTINTVRFSFFFDCSIPTDSFFLFFYLLFIVSNILIFFPSGSSCCIQYTLFSFFILLWFYCCCCCCCSIGLEWKDRENSLNCIWLWHA